MCMQADQTAALVLGEQLSDSDSELECGQEVLEELGEVTFVEDSSSFTVNDLDKWAMADGLAKLQEVLGSEATYAARLGVTHWRINMNLDNARVEGLQQAALRFVSLHRAYAAELGLCVVKGCISLQLITSQWC